MTHDGADDDNLPPVGHQDDDDNDKGVSDLLEDALKLNQDNDTNDNDTNNNNIINHDSNNTTTQHVTEMTLTDATGRRGLYTGPVIIIVTSNDGDQCMPHTATIHGGSTTTNMEPTGTMVYKDDDDDDDDISMNNMDASENAKGDGDNNNNTNKTNHNKVLKFTGTWRDGAWHHGRLQFRTGDVYEGPFHHHPHGAPHNRMGPGWGRYVWADGRVYTGQFDAHGFRDGQGEYTWPNTHAVYKGSFRRNQRHGYGQYTAPGITYTGEWEAGVYSGYGQYEYRLANGTPVTYRGNFVRGQPHGHGKETTDDGTVRFEGEWRAGKPVVAVHGSSAAHGTVAASAPTPAQPPPTPRLIQVVQDQPWVDMHHDNVVATYQGLWNTQTQRPVKNGTVEYGSDGEMRRYEGCFNEAGQFHGKGRLFWNNGDSYEGDFHLGNRHGQGVYRWSDGRQYTGDFVQNIREGQGRLLYTNSDFYEGGFYEGKRHGSGQFIFANGSLYKGHWAAGKYQGHGTLVQADGHTYVGEFTDGMFHGQGQEKDPHGNIVYDGEFIKGYRAGEYVVGAEYAGGENSGGDERDALPSSAAPKTQKGNEPECEAVVDQEVTDCQGNVGRYTGLVLKESRRPHGVGRLVYADGRRIHEGFWQNGSKEGHGRCLFFPQGDFHEGEYCNNLRNGPGRYKWKDGRSFVGTYKDDMRHGKGVFKYPSGDCYQGMFLKGQRSGSGRFEFKGGYYEGEWLAGKYNGKGVLHWGNGTQSYQGEFLQGTFHGKGVKKDADGNVIQEGQWKEGHFHGPDEKKEEEDRPSELAPAQPPSNHESADFASNETPKEAKENNDQGAEVPKEEVVVVPPVEAKVVVTATEQ